MAANNIPPEILEWSEKAMQDMEKTSALIKAGKIKPWSKHLQDKMDSGGPFADEIHDSTSPPKLTDTTE